MAEKVMERSLAALRSMFDRVPPEQAPAAQTLAELGLGFGDEDPAATHDPFNIGMSEVVKPREPRKGIWQRTKEGFLGGFGDDPVGFSHENRERFPQTYLTWQPVVAPVDLAMRGIRGGMYGAAGGAAGLAETFGMPEGDVNRLQRDLGILGQYPGFAAPTKPYIPRGHPRPPGAPPLLVFGPGRKLTFLEDVPTRIGEGDGSIYRAGDSSPSNLTRRPGEKDLSFRNSLSEPYPMGEKGAIFHKPGYRRYDPSKLAPGSVTYDIKPDGHVSVAPPPINSIEKLQEAVIEKGKVPKIDRKTTMEKGKSQNDIRRRQ